MTSFDIHSRSFVLCHENRSYNSMFSFQVPHGVSSDVPPRDQTGNQAFDPVHFRLLLNQRLLEISKERMGLSGVPLPYPPPYLAANTNLAALISRGLLPSGDIDMAAIGKC